MPQRYQDRLTVLMLRRVVAVAVGAVLLGSAGNAAAGLIVSTDVELVSADLQTVGGMSPADESETPLPVSIFALQRIEGTLLCSGGNSSSGAGPQSPTSGPSSPVAGFATEPPKVTHSCLSSRLSQFSRLWLPSPVEDRFFHPPRTGAV